MWATVPHSLQDVALFWLLCTMLPRGYGPWYPGSRGTTRSCVQLGLLRVKVNYTEQCVVCSGVLRATRPSHSPRTSFPGPPVTVAGAERRGFVSKSGHRETDTVAHHCPPERAGAATRRRSLPAPVSLPAWNPRASMTFQMPDTNPRPSLDRNGDETRSTLTIRCFSHYLP